MKSHAPKVSRVTQVIDLQRLSEAAAGDWKSRGRAPALARAHPPGRAHGHPRAHTPGCPVAGGSRSLFHLLQDLIRSEWGAKFPRVSGVRGLGDG